MDFDLSNVTDAQYRLNSAREPGNDVFVLFANSPLLEIRALLYDNLGRYASPYDNLDETAVDNFRVDFLIRSIVEDKASGILYSRGEAAMDLVVWCKTFFQEGKLEMISQMRDKLAQLWRTGNCRIQDVLLTYIFEHIFQVEGIRKVFMKWMNDPELNLAYSKGVELANDFPFVD